MERLSREESLRALEELFGVPEGEEMYQDTGFRVSLVANRIIVDRRGRRTGYWYDKVKGIESPERKIIGFIGYNGIITTADTSRQVTDYRVGGPAKNMVLYFKNQARRLAGLAG